MRRGAIKTSVINKSRINPVLSAREALDAAVSQVDDLASAEDLTYLVGTGYGRNKVPFADENISEISCHAMGVHVVNPEVKSIIDIGGQDVKGIAIDTDGTVLNFAMNDKCAAGTGRFFETMARAFEMSLDEFSALSLKAKNVIPITAQCAVFAESEVISLAGRANRWRKSQRESRYLLRSGVLSWRKSGRHGQRDFDRRLCQERRIETSH